MFKYDPTYSNSLKKNTLLGSKFGTAFDTYIILFVKSKIKLYPLGTEKTSWRVLLLYQLLYLLHWHLDTAQF